MNNASPLSQLRDLHLPEPISWWPLALGWWLLLGLLVLIAALTLWIIRRRQQTKVKREAQSELARIQNNHLQQGDDLQTIKQLSTLLRRVCISLDSRNKVAALTGEDWLNHLDILGNCTVFSTGVGRLLKDAPYRPQPEKNAAELLTLCQDWLNKIPVTSCHRNR